jgi:drug/metabolite transporter (DMT)-like permease
MSTLFVPLIVGVARRTWPSRSVAVGIAIALAGLWFLTGASLHIGKGEALTLGCAAAYAFWLVSQQAHVKALGAMPFAAAQTRTALWLLMEPVFAGLVSWMTGEPLGGRSLGGAALILSGVAISEFGSNDDEDGDDGTVVDATATH